MTCFGEFPLKNDMIWDNYYLMFQSLLKFRLNGGQLMAKTDNLLLLKNIDV